MLSSRLLALPFSWFAPFKGHRGLMSPFYSNFFGIRMGTVVNGRRSIAEIQILLGHPCGFDLRGLQH